MKIAQLMLESRSLPKYVLTAISGIKQAYPGNKALDWPTRVRSMLQT